MQVLRSKSERALRKGAFRVLFLFLTALLVGAPLLGIAPFSPTPAEAAGVLTVEINAGYNLVVDSNVSSPSTYAPRVATVIGKFCNTGDAELNDVYGYIGDGTTPGSYPVYDSDTQITYPYLNNSGDYFFRHVGGTGDASRYIGTIPAGECRYQYWTFEYPACENVGGAWQEPPCASGTDPTWGSSIKPDDDLSLSFTIWGTSDQNNANATWTMTMRNEISAMANKIEPNGNPPGRWFNLEDESVQVGDIITTNGILYSLGNVRFGFDNEYLFSVKWEPVPEKPAKVLWLQEVENVADRLARGKPALAAPVRAGPPRPAATRPGSPE